jgi:hypothetical protein
MTSFHKSTTLMLIAALASALTLGAADAPPGSQDNPYLIPRTGVSIKIDGDLQEIAWRNALMVTLDYEVRPRDNAPANVRTEVYFTYDASNLYVGFLCHDPEPSQIRAFLRDRDTLGGDDWVAIEMDTYNDHRHAFTLFSTPLGVQADGLSDAAGIKDYSWDTIYDSAGKLTEQGYSVEMAIPFSSLRFQRTSGPQIWGINIVRGLTRNQRYQIWSAPYDRGNSCRVCQYLRFQGFEGVTPGRNIEINPTVTGTLTRARPDLPNGDYETAYRDAELGVTGRWGMTPNLFLGATINPDFSQVEADALQLDINQPFALFYEERRPFFTDGSDFFQTGLDLIYTRTVRDPHWGVKLTGKQGDHAIGAFVAEDKVTNILIPGTQSSGATSLDESNLSGAFRYSWDTWNNSDLGIILTSRKSAHYSNLVYGVTSLIRLGDNDTFTAELLGSSTEYDQATAETFAQPDNGFSDIAFTLDYVHKTSNYTGELGVSEVGEDFRADLGFIPKVGYRSYSTRSIYEWRNSSDRSWWSSMRLLNSIYYEELTEPSLTKGFKARRYPTIYTLAGSDDPPLADLSPILTEGMTLAKANGGVASNSDLLSKGVATSFRYIGPLETTVFAGNITSREVYNGIAFDLSQFDLSLSMVPSGNLSFDIWATFGDHIDFANTRKGDRLKISSSLSLNLGTHFDLSLSHAREEMDSAGDWLYQADITQATLIYSFTSRAFVRSIVQLVDYQYNTGNYSFPIEPTHERLYSQLLFSYKVNPRTVLFAGYSDNSRSGLGYGLTRSDYTLFVKLGYALVL